MDVAAERGTRPPIRAALVRFWTRLRLLRAPVPLTGPRALNTEAPPARSAWPAAFLEALASEATENLELLRRRRRPRSRRPAPST